MRLSNTLRLLAAFALTGCTIQDSRTAREAQTKLLGMNETDLQTCLGAPDQRSTIGSTKILSYATSSSGNGGLSLTLPLIGGFSLSGSGSCRVNVRLDNDRVTKIRYSGDSDALGAPDAYCAPVVRSCVKHPEPYWSQPGAATPIANRPPATP